MADNGQQPLFYEDAYDAIEKAIASSGKTKKDLASIIYPGRKIETAMSLLTRALTPENTDVNLNLEMILTILRETRPDDFLYFLCDEFGFDRPVKKNKETFEKEIKKQVKGLQEQLVSLVRQLGHMEKIK
jgi:hypothetical protein